MPFDPNAKDIVIGVVGTGTMGRGIVQVAAQGGMKVIAYDEKPGGAQAAKDFIAKMLGSQVEKGRIPADQAKAALERITVATKLDELAKANCIVEAIFERLDIKQEMFAKLDAMAGPDVILASNTSSLLVSEIANRCKHPERVGGMHFFNPVPLMKLVEVIPGLRTSQWVTDALMTIGRRMTREPVLCVDSPGFLVNHIGRGLGPETQRILQEGIASVAEIDRILTGAPGFRMGSFTLGDLVGIDVGNAAMASMYEQFFHEPAYAPTPLMALRAAGGMYGQKTGSGWYAYKDGKKVEPAHRAPPAKCRLRARSSPISIDSPKQCARRGDVSFGCRSKSIHRSPAVDGRCSTGSFSARHSRRVISRGSPRAPRATRYGPSWPSMLPM